jgi:preprotein translocase SecE subunit
MGGMKVAESEEDFERATPRPEPAAPSNVSDARFRFFMMASALAACFCAGASLYFLGTTPVPGVKVPVNVWMGAGVALTLGLAWFVLAKLSPRLHYSKPGQGRWARLSAYVGFAVVALFGAVALHGLPAYGSKWFGGEHGLWETKLLGRLFTLRPVFFPAAGFFLGSMVAFHLFINRPRSAEFLVETQGEMKRVSWPTRREWIGSTLVVLVLVFVLSMFLYAVDSWVLSPLMQKLRIGF